MILLPTTLIYSVQKLRATMCLFFSKNWSLTVRLRNISLLEPSLQIYGVRTECISSWIFKYSIRFEFHKTMNNTLSKNIVELFKVEYYKKKKKKKAINNKSWIKLWSLTDFISTLFCGIGYCKVKTVLSRRTFTITLRNLITGHCFLFCFDKSK